MCFFYRSVIIAPPSETFESYRGLFSGAAMFCFPPATDLSALFLGNRYLGVQQATICSRWKRSFVVRLVFLRLVRSKVSFSTISAGASVGSAECRCSVFAEHCNSEGHPLCRHPIFSNQLFNCYLFFFLL